MTAFKMFLMLFFIFESTQVQAQNTKFMLKKEIGSFDVESKTSAVLVSCKIFQSGKIQITRNHNEMTHNEFREGRFATAHTYQVLQSKLKSIHSANTEYKSILTPLLPNARYFAKDLDNGKTTQIAYFGEQVVYKDSKDLRSIMKLMDNLCQIDPPYSNSSLIP